MYTKTLKIQKIKFWWRQHGDMALACAGGFFLGLLIAWQLPRLQAYLLTSVMEERHVALEQTATEHAAAPDVLISQSDVTESPMPSLQEQPQEQLPIIPEVSPLEVTPTPAPVEIKIHEEEHAPVAPVESHSSSSSASSTPAIVRELPQPAPAPEATASSSSSSISSSSSLPSSSSSSSSSVPSAASVPSSEGFPAFGNALYPVSRVPNWGAMTTPAEWNRTYQQMTDADRVDVPPYDMRKLTVDFQSLLNPRNIAEITRQLFYSTHYFGAYDVNAPEFSAVHPGIDLKLALGTPLGTIGGGRVQTVENSGPLGLHVIIEHRVGGEIYYSIYGHLGFAAVHPGDDVRSGQFIGTVGMTGNTGGPHLHLQIDRGHGEAVHIPYLPASLPSPEEAAQWVMNPMPFIAQH